ncbi:hypothetical protein HCH52_06135, partial [Oscillospiraceae bacterium HV4-5-C5C]|nr:hypothetical protein [Oscillospiraceae bacterium HV4-5-C5C]
EYQSILAAAPVFSLYGVDDPQRTLPAQPHPEQPYHDGRVGYHLRRGTHYLSRHDWQQFIAYRERWQV